MIGHMSGPPARTISHIQRPRRTDPRKVRRRMIPEESATSTKASSHTPARPPVRSQALHLPERPRLRSHGAGGYADTREWNLPGYTPSPIWYSPHPDAPSRTEETPPLAPRVAGPLAAAA